MKKSSLIFLLVNLLLITINGISFAQEQPENGPVYIVQEGDNLWSIALRFGVSLDELKVLNGISDEGQISAGARLVIPGFENMEISGILNTATAEFGEDLRSISRRTNVPVEGLARLNHLVSPAEIYVGMPVIVVESEETPPAGMRPILGSGMSLLELAVIRQANPWNFVIANLQDDTNKFLPGEVLWLPSAKGTSGGPGAIPDAVASINVDPTPAVQGRTSQVRIQGVSGILLFGSLHDHPLNFFSVEEGIYYALQGVHALLAPGFYPIMIDGELPGGEKFSYAQQIFVKDGGYVIDPVLTVSPETIDPAVTRPEDAQWQALISPVTPEKFWEGKFRAPVPPEFAECYPSRFGSRRSYNGSAYDYFHTGLDFCGNKTTDIYAPAAGVVVFAGPLTVRGNATVIDHGQGVYTGYLHQSEIFVEAGDRIEPGQLIGKIGATGRVTGPHLHLEVWVGGVQVDPMQWLEESFPFDTLAQS